MKIIHGECVEQMLLMDEGSVDAIVTDPPYELAFMGKKWDSGGVSFSVATWSAALRVLRPGGHLLAFGGTRTYHRMACAIEDSGFEIRDQIGWVYGQGFPKSHNGEWGGTALKPAWEPIVLARKPLVGTVESNWRKHGVGGLNIDACRVDAGGENPSAARRQGAVTHLSKRPARESEAAGRIESRTSESTYRRERPGEALGRWPANVIHDGSDEVLAAFPESPGQQGDLVGHSRNRISRGIYGDMPAARNAIARNDSGSAARFFYCAKASRKERGEGNNHPTVKPIALMRYLCRLVTPAGGLVLDPFCGSGTTGVAAAAEGMHFIGIERDEESFSTAMRRIGEAS